MEVRVGDYVAPAGGAAAGNAGLGALQAAGRRDGGDEPADARRAEIRRRAGGVVVEAGHRRVESTRPARVRTARGSYVGGARGGVCHARACVADLVTLQRPRPEEI